MAVVCGQSLSLYSATDNLYTLQVDPDSLLLPLCFVNKEISLTLNDVEQVGKLLAILSPLTSHLCICAAYPFNYFQFEKVFQFVLLFAGLQNFGEDVQGYMPELLLLLEAQPQDHASRDKSSDHSVFESALKKNHESQAAQAVKSYYKRRDCIVVNRVADNCLELEYLRLKVLKTRPKPSHYTKKFLFTAQQSVKYFRALLSYIFRNKPFAGLLKTYQSVASPVLCQTNSSLLSKLKVSLGPSSQEEIYKSWANQIDETYHAKILKLLAGNSPAKESFLEFAKEYTSQLNKRLLSYQQRNVADKAAMVAKEAQRLAKVIRQLNKDEASNNQELEVKIEDIMNHLSVACGLRYEDVANYLELKGQGETSRISVSEADLDLQKSNMPIQSHVQTMFRPHK